MSIADQARKIPGVAAAEGAITGAVATEQDLPIADYDKQTADEIATRLKGFSQRELRLVDAYERKHENRATITDKIAKLTGEEPWSGYDEQSVDAITAALRDADADTARSARAYERERKDRAGVGPGRRSAHRRQMPSSLPPDRHQGVGGGGGGVPLGRRRASAPPERPSGSV